MISLNRNTYNRRSDNNIILPIPKTLKHGNTKLCFMFTHYWNMLPSDIKNVESHTSFKYEIKRRQPKCTCRTCFFYVKF